MNSSYLLLSDSRILEPRAYVLIDGQKYYLTYGILQWIVDRAEFCANMSNLFEILLRFNVKNSRGNELNYSYFYKWAPKKNLNFWRKKPRILSPQALIDYNYQFQEFFDKWEQVLIFYIKNNCPKI